MSERPKKAQASARARPHVLIVTADQGLQVFLSEGLVLGGFWTSTVASALQVLEVFRIRTFDLLLLDGLLPGMSALEMVARLRGRSQRAIAGTPRTDIPIWLIAERPEELAETVARAAGGDGVLYAPLELDELGPRLHQIVAAWRAAHSDRPWADELAATTLPPPPSS